IQETARSRSRTAVSEETEPKFTARQPAHTVTQGIEPIGTVLSRRQPRTTASEREARQVIESYIRDFAREFNDRAPLKSSVTRAVRDMREAGMTLDAFISVLYEA